MTNLEFIEANFALIRAGVVVAYFPSYEDAAFKLQDIRLADSGLLLRKRKIVRRFIRALDKHDSFDFSSLLPEYEIMEVKYRENVSIPTK